jgi:hypothetical protein
VKKSTRRTTKKSTKRLSERDWKSVGLYWSRDYHGKAVVSHQEGDDYAQKVLRREIPLKEAQRNWEAILEGNRRAGQQIEKIKSSIRRRLLSSVDESSDPGEPRRGEKPDKFADQVINRY